MPETQIAAQLQSMETTRASLVEQEQRIADLLLTRSDLAQRRDRLVSSGADKEAAALAKRIAATDDTLQAGQGRRGELLGTIADLSDGLVEAFSPEILTGTLDGNCPVAMLPVRIETRFATPTKLQVRVYPDQLHIDAHDPALTADEVAGAQWYWAERWRAGLEDRAAAGAAWQGLVSRFRPGRASYLVQATTPTNLPAAGDPAFPETPGRESTWSRAPLATALPDRFCVVGLAQRDGVWTETFRRWGSAVPDSLAVGPDPRLLTDPGVDGELPVDEGTRWLREPEPAIAAGTLIEVEHPSLAEEVERLVVLGVDWTQHPEQAATSLAALLSAQRYSGHLGFVPQGTPTNSTADSRSGYSSATSVEAAALDPAAAPAVTDAWSAGQRLASALGVAPGALAGVPGCDLREQAWASSLTDVLWRGTAGFYISDLLDPLAKDDPQVDADLREFTRSYVFASGPLPTLRVGAQPYGVLPVVSARSYQPGVGRAEELVHRVAALMRAVVSPAIQDVPRLLRAGERQDVDSVLLALLQRTPVPWTFRFRPLTGPVERKSLSVYWDLANAWQRTWTTAMWAGLNVNQNARLSELTLGADSPLPVPLVTKPGQQNPTAYLSEIADLTTDPNGTLALNLREDSIALLEALAACSALMELNRCSLQATRDRLALTSETLALLPALSALAVPTPYSSRIEAAPAVPLAALDFRSGRALADAVVPQVSALPLGQYVTTEFASRMVDLADLLGAPADPFYWLANHQVALRALAQAPVDQLEWAFRGYLDLFSTRLDAWFTGLASARLAHHRQTRPVGLHIGCWGFVEDLRRDVGAGAESLGFVHTPSLAHATSTALLRNGRLANRGSDGAVFDLQITSDRVRRARWLLDGVAAGQNLAALLGYRLERGLREAGLDLMRYQMPMRRTAPLRGPDVAPEVSVEVLAARDVVDGVALLDRWRDDPDGVLGAIAAQAGLAALPSADGPRLRAVIDGAYDSYDAVSDVLVAESVHQTAVGNLDRAGAALTAHDRHGRAPDLDYVGSPRSGHTVAHRVGIVLQSPALSDGWNRDPRGAAEPLLDSWIGQLLGDPGAWQFAALSTAGDGTTTVLTPVSLADLGLGPLSVAMACQSPGQGRPSELAQLLGLAFAAQLPPDPTLRLELLANSPNGAGGLALLETLGDWAARLTAGSALTAADFTSSADLRVPAAPGTTDEAELAGRVASTRSALASAVQALAAAGSADECAKALLGAVPFDGPDAIPGLPVGHPDAATALAAQASEVLDRLTVRSAAVDAALGEALPDGDAARVARHTSVLKAMLGAAQPVLPRWTLADTGPVTASLADRPALLGEAPTSPASWLQRSALVRSELEPFAGLMMHHEAAGHDVAGELNVMQQPHRPGTPWLALPFAGTPPNGSVGLVLHSCTPLDATAPFAGLIVDAWTETIPADRETTAVTFHYDAPGAAAPQSVLLAVHPDPQPEKWSFDLLLETVNEAADLARLRTLSSVELAPMGSFLPALYLPDDYTHDVPSVSLTKLVRQAQAAGISIAYADVLGKA